MQPSRNASDQRTSVRVVVAPATSPEVALLFSGAIALLLLALLLL